MMLDLLAFHWMKKRWLHLHVPAYIFTYFSVLILNSYSYSILYFVLFLYPSLHLHAHLQVHILVLLTLLILNLNLNTHLVTIHWMYTVKSDLRIINIPFVLHVFFFFYKLRILSSTWLNYDFLFGFHNAIEGQ